MKNKLKVCVGSIALLAGLVGVLRGEGAIWVYDGVWQSICGPGQTSCQYWDEYNCEAGTPYADNCTAGTSKRENVANGHCEGTVCQSGF